MAASKFLFWLGVVIMVVELAANIYTVARMVSVHAIGLNGGAVVVTLFGSLYQGALLIGVAKILEVLHTRTK